MILKKNFINNIFEETLQQFKDLIVEVDNEVAITYQDKEGFMKSVIENPHTKMLIDVGYYKDIDKEYSSFAVVYQQDKIPFRAWLGLPYKVTFCFDIAKDKLKPFKPTQVKEYLKFVLAHELTHVFEDVIKVKKPELWEEALKHSANDVSLAHENLANNVAEMLTDKHIVDEVEDEISKVTKSRVGRIMKRMGR
jgi:hypothetical protein